MCFLNNFYVPNEEYFIRNQENFFKVLMNDGSICFWETKKDFEEDINGAANAVASFDKEEVKKYNIKYDDWI